MLSQKGFMPTELLSAIFFVLLAITIPVILNSNQQIKTLFSKAEQENLPNLATPSVTLSPTIILPTTSIASGSSIIIPTITTIPTPTVLSTISLIPTQEPTFTPVPITLTPTPPPTTIETIVNSVLNIVIEPFMLFTATPTPTPIPTSIPIPTLTVALVPTQTPTTILPSPTPLPTAIPTRAPTLTPFLTATPTPKPIVLPTVIPIPTQTPISTPIRVSPTLTPPPTTIETITNNVLNVIIDPFISLLNTFNKQPQPTPIPTLIPSPTPIGQSKKTILSVIEETQKVLAIKPSPTAFLFPTTVPTLTRIPVIISPTIFPSPTSSPQPPKTIIEKAIEAISIPFTAVLNNVKKQPSITPTLVVIPIPTLIPSPTSSGKQKKSILSTIEKAQLSLNAIPTPTQTLLPTTSSFPTESPLPTVTLTPLPTPTPTPKPIVLPTVIPIPIQEPTSVPTPDPIVPTTPPTTTNVLIPTMIPSPIFIPSPTPPSVVVTEKKTGLEAVIDVPKTIVENIVNFIDNVVQSVLNIFNKSEEQPSTTIENQNNSTNKNIPMESDNKTNQTITTYDYSSDAIHDNILLQQIKNDKGLSVNLENVESEITHAVGKENILVVLGKMTSQEFDEQLLPTPGNIQSRINSTVSNLYLKNSDNKLSFEAEIIPYWYKLATSLYDMDQLRGGGDGLYKRILTMIFLDSQNDATIKQLLDKQTRGRIVIIVAVDQNNPIIADNFATLGRSLNVKIDHKKETFQGTETRTFTANISLTMVFLPIHTTDTPGHIGLLQDPQYQTREGTFSEFDKVLARSLGRNLGLGGSFLIKQCNLDSLQIINRSVAEADYGGSITLFNSDRLISIAPIQALYDTYSHNEKQLIRNLVGSTISCAIERNPLDLMGESSEGFYMNASFQKKLGWLTENKQIIRLDVDGKTESSYTLQENPSGLKAAYMPYSYQYGDVVERSYEDETGVTFGANIQGLSQQEYYLDPRLNTDTNKQSLHITVPSGRDLFLFSNNGKNGLNLKDSFYDQINKIMLQVTDTNEKTLTFKITPCDGGANLFNIVPQRTTTVDNVTHLNFFESFFRSNINLNRPATLHATFGLENTSNCFNREYTIDKKSIKITQGQTQILGYTFTDEKLKIKSHQYDSVGLNVSMSIDEQGPYTNIDSTIEFDIFTNMDSSNNSDNKQKYIQHLTFQFHAIPTPEEYKNDLEPFMIDIKDKDTNNKKFDYLETHKGQTLVFSSSIANNSRNPDGNKSSDFFVKWYIQDEKGKDIVSQVQRHEGIPPKTLDNADPAQLQWIIPDSIPQGNYKIILAVDYNNKLQEFNENNNVIWRYIKIEK
ncbi:MAG TPA: hypothetical protein VJB63_02635 [Patescibacteria group bacterium]|nr:hypothetical protein [Patescibacteria group bacterium]